MQSRLLIEQWKGQEISQLNTARDLERMRKHTWLPYNFLSRLLMDTAGYHFLGWTDHQSEPVPPVLTREKDQHSLGCRDMLVHQAASTAVGRGWKAERVLGESRTKMGQVGQNNRVMPLTEGRWKNPLENFMYVSWDKQNIFLILMSRSSFSKLLFIPQ